MFVRSYAMWSLKTNYRILVSFTSSSSYIVSVKKGMSSDLVRSTPKANAIVDSFFIEFNRNWTSSFRSYTHVKYKITIISLLNQLLSN